MIAAQLSLFGAGRRPKRGREQPDTRASPVSSHRDHPRKPRGGSLDDASRLRAAVSGGASPMGGGRTADEIAAGLRRSILSVRPRVSELHADGKIMPTDDRRRNESGILSDGVEGGHPMSRRYGNRRTTIGGQFAPHTIEMLRSPAWCALSLSARRVLDRIEIELADHGGVDNGKLPVTYDDFCRYGIHRHAIGPAIREAVALGFMEITEPGRAGNAEFRKPNLFRLTYRNTRNMASTDEWKKIDT